RRAEEESSAVARGANPLCLGAYLCERRIGQDLLDRDSQAVEQRQTARGEQKVIGAFAREEAFRKEQVRGALLVRDLEVAVQVVQTQRPGKVIPLFGDLRTGQARHP